MDTNKTNSVIFRPNGNLIMKTNQRDLKKKKNSIWAVKSNIICIKKMLQKHNSLDLL